MAPSSTAHGASPKVARVSRGKELAKAACYTCRRKKVRCSGTSPCTYCSKRGLDCALPEHGQRRSYSIVEIQELRERLARFENKSSSTNSDTADIQSQSPPPIDDTVSLTAEHTVFRTNTSTSNVTNDQATQLLPELMELNEPSIEASNPLNHQEIHRDSHLTSSHTFSSRVQSLLETSSSQRINETPITVNSPTMLPGMQEIPTESEARRLLEVVIFYVGETQHHFDVREFADGLGVFYTNPQDSMQQQTPWFLEMLLILAIGQLFSECTHDQNEIPGSNLFHYAYKHLPTLGELYTHGVLGVEILALVAVYLQNLNRKDEAYLHISTALRLAVSLGFHRRSSSHHLLQSRQVHINRLWWTVYMQERRLAAATGNPFSINDDAIELAPPADCIGYPTSGLLRTNLRISRVLSRILTVIYGPRRLPEDDFVPNVRDIVKSILEIAQEIPPQNFASHPGLSLDSSTRASAYLHIMLYQALILTTRPVMLHVAKQILNGELTDSTTLDASPLGRFSRSCSEAARRLLDVIARLRKRNMLIIFGFFDFDAVFSAAFVMILSAIIESIGTNNRSNGHLPPPGLQDALETLQYLANRGNYFAQRGYEGAHQTWLHFTSYQQRELPQKNDSPMNSSSEPASETSVSGTLTSDTQGALLAPRIMSSDADTTTGMFPGAALANEKIFGSAADAPNTTSLFDMELLGDLAHLCGGGADDASTNIFAGVSGCASTATDDLHQCLYPMYSNLDLGPSGDDVEHFAEFRKSVLNF